ncbi:hypothetical protein BJ138DRAFT_1235985, partial [Hygrophoropsis aurantiaca]
MGCGCTSHSVVFHTCHFVFVYLLDDDRVSKPLRSMNRIWNWSREESGSQLEYCYVSFAQQEQNLVAAKKRKITNYKTHYRGPRAKNLPPEITSLIKTAKKYRLNFAPIKLSTELKEEMPAWLHVGIPTQAYHWTKDRCLRENHNIVKTVDLIRTAQRINRQDNTANRHSPRSNCKCRDCKNDRTAHCKNPHKCATIAKGILDKISTKMSNSSKAPKDDLSLTHRRKEKNAQVIKAGRGEIIFDPSVTSYGSLKECFRIFTDPRKISDTPAYRRTRAPGTIIQDIPTLEIYTDGSCHKNGKMDAVCGSGVWAGEDHPINKAAKLPGPNQSNQAGEIAAIIYALEEADNFTPIHFVTD